QSDTSLYMYYPTIQKNPRLADEEYLDYFHLGRPICDSKNINSSVIAGPFEQWELDVLYEAISRAIVLDHTSIPYEYYSTFTIPSLIEQPDEIRDNWRIKSLMSPQASIELPPSDKAGKDLLVIK